MTLVQEQDTGPSVRAGQDILLAKNQDVAPVQNPVCDMMQYEIRDYAHLAPNLRDVQMSIGSLESICYYINAHHKQYIQVDIIFICHVGLPGKCLWLSPRAYTCCVFSGLV